MKFYQLISAFRSEPNLLYSVFTTGDWGEFTEWYECFDSLVARQDRSKLDAEVPELLVQTTANRSMQAFRLAGGTLRSSKHATDGLILSARDVVDRFGGSVIEGVHEYGSAKVDPL